VLDAGLPSRAPQPAYVNARLWYTLMNKFDAAAESIADRLWKVLERELANDAITELQLRRAFTEELANALAEILVQTFVDTGAVKSLVEANGQE